jgi:Flp pilus assembly protein TadB
MKKSIEEKNGKGDEKSNPPPGKTDAVLDVNVPAKETVIAANPEKESFFKRLFKLRIRSRDRFLASAGKAIPQKTNKLLFNEMTKIRKEKEKRIKKKEKIFTLRGLIKVIDLQALLEKAGLEHTDPKKVAKQFLHINVVIFAFITFLVTIKAFVQGAELLNFLVFVAGIWLGLFALGLILLWLAYLFYLDMKIYNRTKEVEKVFPDFLELASSNISAGMPIDRALWYAVRPNFGVLAKEIEHVAKNTIAGEDLSVALMEFSKKYDSKVIQRSISLLLEGLAAGGELSELLNKIALNIEETRILKRDMAANVTTYVIFITFASIVAAPALLGLSTQLLAIISKITASISTQNSSSSAGFFSFSFSSSSVSVQNFKIFAYVMLTISSISAAAIVNIIQTGKVKDGIYRIPTFIAISLAIYFLSSYFMGSMFSGLI